MVPRGVRGLRVPRSPPRTGGSTREGGGPTNRFHTASTHTQPPPSTPPQVPQNVSTENPCKTQGSPGAHPLPPPPTPSPEPPEILGPWERSRARAREGTVFGGFRAPGTHAPKPTEPVLLEHGPGAQPPTPGSVCASAVGAVREKPPRPRPARPSRARAPGCLAAARDLSVCARARPRSARPGRAGLCQAEASRPAPAGCPSRSGSGRHADREHPLAEQFPNQSVTPNSQRGDHTTITHPPPPPHPACSKEPGHPHSPPPKRAVPPRAHPKNHQEPGNRPPRTRLFALLHPPQTPYDLDPWESARVCARRGTVFGGFRAPGERPHAHGDRPPRAPCPSQEPGPIDTAQGPLPRGRDGRHARERRGNPETAPGRQPLAAGDVPELAGGELHDVVDDAV